MKNLYLFLFLLLFTANLFSQKPMFPEPLSPRIANYKIDVTLDDTEHAVYFEQAGNGVPVRKAILALVLGKK